MMKRRDVLKELKKIAKTRGEEMTTKEGANHTHVRIGKSFTLVPRHPEIDEYLTKEIFKQIGRKK